MIKAIFSPLSFRKPVSFDYHGSIDEGIKILTKHVKRTTLHAGLKNSLVGKVTAAKVRIYRYRKLAAGQYGMGPVFIGIFTQKDGKTLLKGEFKLHEGSRAAFIFSVIGTILFWVSIAIRDLDTTSSISDISQFIYIPIVQ